MSGHGAESGAVGVESGETISGVTARGVLPSVKLLVRPGSRVVPVGLGAEHNGIWQQRRIGSQWQVGARGSRRRTGRCTAPYFNRWRADVGRQASRLAPDCSSVDSRLVGIGAVTLAPPFVLVDRYDVTDEIGRGGHAIVYRAFDRTLEREVAIKLLRDDALSSDSLARFRQEVQVTAQLEHAHILHVYDTGAYEGRPYIVMELASGRTLAERLEREGQLPVSDAVHIARDVGYALAHAHARGIVHRDVKPDNILLGSGGAILADFGIARVTKELLANKITLSGTAVGTVQYMSPEQLCADPGIDARSDQYSLACVLYEMLAGVRPHIAATFEGLRMLRMTGRHVPVSAHRPSVPAAVDVAIGRALSAMPADRYRTVEEMLLAMGVGASGEFGVSGGWGVAGESVPIRKVSTTEALSDRRSSWVRVAVVAIGVAALLVALLSHPFARASARRNPEVMPSSASVATIDIRLEVQFDSTSASVRAQTDSSIASLRGLLEVVPQLRVSAVESSAVPRYIARLTNSPRGDGTSSWELFERGTSNAVFRSASGVNRLSASDFGAASALGMLRAVAARDSAFPTDYRLVIAESERADVVERLLTGWQRFGSGDDASAEVLLRAAVHIEPSSRLARARLAAVLLTQLKFGEAYDLAASTETTSASRSAAAENTLLGFRYHAARMPDSAVAAFKRAVADNPENVDGWYGLAQTLYFQGWVAGYALGDASEAFANVLRLAPGFSRIREQQFDVAMAKGDTASARSILRLIPAGDRWIDAKRMVFALITARDDERKTVLSSFARSPAPMLSEVILQLSRPLHRRALAVLVAEMLAQHSRPTDERRRAYQMLLVLVPGDSGTHWVSSLDSVDAPNRFDPWIAARCLAGACDSERVTRLALAANVLLRDARDSVLRDHGSDASQAMDFLTQLALLSGSFDRDSPLATRVRRLAQSAHPSDPLARTWRSTLAAADAMHRSDTSTAAAALTEAITRIDAPFDAFFPMRSNPSQRSMVAKFSKQVVEPRLLERIQRSFTESWSIADAILDRRTPQQK